MAAMNKPILAVTMGDPAGIGPEVIVRAWDDEHIHEHARLLVAGHPDVMARAAKLVGRNVARIRLQSPKELESSAPSRQSMPIINVCADDAATVTKGTVDARAGEAAYQCVTAAARWALAKEIDGIVTAPLSKAALHAAGHRYPGHTELLAEMCGVRDFAMMLYLPGTSECATARGAGRNIQTESRTACLPALADDSRASSAEAAQTTDWSAASSGTQPIIRSQFGLGVAHVTLHQSLRSVFADLTPSAIIAKCRLAHDVMRRLGASEPRIAVCALNPHAGEEGLFGDEEQTIIAPAVSEARQRGLNVSGPYPTDTLMMRARDGEFDAVVAMYHDQGHIALKLLGMHAAVNITLGLPIVRTSVAHGTAFDRAWQGTARAEGMVAAILTAAKLARTQASDVNCIA
jgi:4-hydroxy-L-threonine phosphate dehydrogenase PdxA